MGADGRIDLGTDAREGGGVQYAFLVGERFVVVSYVQGSGGDDEGPSAVLAEIPRDLALDQPIPSGLGLVDSPAIMEEALRRGATVPATVHLEANEGHLTATVVGGVEVTIDLAAAPPPSPGG